MSSTTMPGGTERQVQTHATQALEWLLGIAVAWVIVVPRSTPFVMLVLALAVAAVPAARQMIRIAMRPASYPTWLWGIIAFLLWAATTAAWSPVPLGSLGKVLQVAAVVASAYVAMRGLASCPTIDRSRLVLAILRGLLAGMAYLALEELTQISILTAFVNAVRGIEGPSQSQIIYAADGSVASITLTVLNRNMVALGLCLWPALAWLYIRGGNSRIRQLSAITLGVAGAAILLLSFHKSSRAAIALAAIVLLLAWAWPRVAPKIVMVLWILVSLLMIPAVKSMDSLDLEKAPWLFSSARDRIYIWAFTAEQWKKAPIRGVGADATPYYNEEMRRDPAEQARLNRHAHNVFVQTWYELGAVGAMLLCIMGLTFLRAIERFNAHVRPFALAQFTGFMAVAAFAFGMWQIWLSSLVAFSAVLWSVVLANVAARVDST